MVAAGAREEVLRAASAGVSETASKALGFEELLAGDVERMKRRTRNYARRQLTWMRKLAGVAVIDVTRPRPGGRGGRDPRLRRPMTMRFEKWQALGNDYLIVERDELPFELTPARVRRLCEGHFGVFADGVLLLSAPAEPRHVADLRIFNPDGSEAELSGNGAREAILYLRRRGWTDRDEFAIATAAGTIRPTITGADSCRVDMGRAALTSADFPGGPPDGRGTVTSAGREWAFRHVSIGNPQCAIGLAERRGARRHRPAGDGPADRSLRRCSPTAPTSPGTRSSRPAKIRARIFERGVGETLSSGTGATGAAVAYVQETAGGRASARR